MIVEISLQGLEFFSRHGWLEEERKKGGKFIVHIKMEADIAGAMTHDDLSGTVDYSAVYEVVKQEMDVSSRLLEHLAGRIANRIRSDFPTILTLHVEVRKMDPPIGGKAEYAAVKLSD
jgi:7,8-dihydroneopterin aldolase/epimerase/oxygenase